MNTAVTTRSMWRIAVSLGLLDHVIGAHEQRRRDREAQRLRRLEVDHQLQLRRLRDRNITWFGALEDVVDVRRRLAELTREAWPERRQTARLRIFATLD